MKAAVWIFEDFHIKFIKKRKGECPFMILNVRIAEKKTKFSSSEHKICLHANHAAAQT
jgi:hypothetical protein